MPKLTITLHVTAPDGKYCVCLGKDVKRVEPCEQLEESSQTVGWEDGLGPPGEMSHYRCSVFRKGRLRVKRTCGLIIEKCSECLSA